MGVRELTVMGLGAILVTVNVTMIGSWDLAGLCPGTETFCEGVWWQATEEYAPGLLFLAQIMVVIAMGSPLAIFSVRR